MNICVKNKVNDNDCRVLILEATIDGSDYLLINLYNAKTEREKLTTMKNVNNLWKTFEDFHDKNVIFARDFNSIFDKNLESVGLSPLLKKHSLSEIIKLNKTFSLCDFGEYLILIKNYSFSNKNIYNEDLIIFFVSNSLQESVKKKLKF